jgi:hypothetical protein
MSCDYNALCTRELRTWRLWYEEHPYRHEQRDDVDNAQGNEVRVLAGEVVRRIVDDCADQGAEGGPALEHRDHQTAVACWC